MKEFMRQCIKDRTNFVFLGEAGSGKSEIAINFARYLTELGDKPVHFFDMDMTKPLFRSRDMVLQMEEMGIVCHHEEQFYDAPTMVGGVNLLLKDEESYVVLDVGGSDIGARAIGGYAPKINQKNTIVYYILNAFRPWSADIEHIDGTLSAVLGVSHVQLGQVHMVNNPNNGITTTPEEVVEGLKRMREMVAPYMEMDFACVKEELYETVKEQVQGKLMPIKLYLTYEWLLDGPRIGPKYPSVGV